MAITGSEQDTSRGTSEHNGGIAQTLRDTTYRRLDDQKARASDTLGSFAGAVRGMTQPLRDGGQGAVADYVNKAADRIEQWASTLQQKDVEDAARAVQQFARRQPALFLGMAFTAGVIAARLLKSSSDGQVEQRHETIRTTGAGPMGSTDFGTRPFGTGQFGTTASDIPRVSPDTRSTGEVI